MRNNMTPKVRDIAKTHLVYDFQCKEGECAHLPNKQTRYTGLTTCTLSRRLSFHLQNGAIKEHFLDKHNRNITRAEIVNYTKARFYERDVRRLEILESLIIRFEDPDINRQDTGKRRKLHLFGSTVLTSSPQEWIGFMGSHYTILSMFGLDISARCWSFNCRNNQILVPFNLPRSSISCTNFSNFLF